MCVEKQFNVYNSNLGMALSALRHPLRVLASMNEVKEVLIQYCQPLPTWNVLNMAKSADPDETPHFAASHQGLRYL